MVAVGIDTGEAAIHVCVADDSMEAARWAVVELDLTDAGWHEALVALVPRGAVVAIEPTGWYYSRPIVQVLVRHGCRVAYVRHETTEAARLENVSSQKTDPNDARALAFKARQFAGGGYVRGVRAAHLDQEDLVIRLRTTVAARRLYVRLRGGAMNRLRTFARGVWPSLSNHMGAYLRAMGAGAFAPAELQALSLGQEVAASRVVAYRHGLCRRGLRELVAEIPEDVGEIPASIVVAMRLAFADLGSGDARIEALEEDLRLAIEQDPIGSVTRLWRTVPGAWDVAIATIHSACRCEVLQMTPDEMRAACGCHPSRQESGKVEEAHEGKRGYRAAKSALHLWTMALLNPRMTPANVVRDYYDRLKRENHRYAVHSARGKLVRILHGIAVNGKGVSLCGGSSIGGTRHRRWR